MIEIDLIELFSLFIKRRKIILIFTAVFFTLSLLFLFFSTPWYAASVKIMPAKDDYNGGILNQYAGIAAVAGLNISSNLNNFDLYPEIVKSSFILNQILVHRFNTSNYKLPVTLFEFWETSIDSSIEGWKHILWENAKSNLKENYLTVDIDRKTGIMTITAMAPNDPELAAELANFTANSLDFFNKHFRNYKTSEQLKYIIKSLNSSNKELRKSEEKLKSFLDRNKDYSSPQKKFEYEKIKTEYDLQKTIYIELRKQKELAEIDKIKETETLNILEEATIPIQKSRPKSFIILVLFPIFGFILGLFYVLILRLFHIHSA